jgi:ABC-2 type transport system permease protein
MTGCAALFFHSARRFRPVLLAFGAVLAGFQVLLALAAEAIQQSDSFRQISEMMPDFVRQALGPTAITVMSFAGVVAIGYFHLAVVSVLVGFAVAIGTEPVSELETGFLDLVLATPIGRLCVVGRTAALLFAGSAALILAMMAGTFAGVSWLAPGSVSHVMTTARSLAVNLWLVTLCWGGIALLATSFSKRRSVPAAATGILAFTSYVIDYLARVWAPARWVSWLSPFHYFNAADMIAGAKPPSRDLLVLCCASLAATVLAALRFSRRDL